MVGVASLVGATPALAVADGYVQQTSTDPGFTHSQGYVGSGIPDPYVQSVSPTLSSITVTVAQNSSASPYVNAAIGCYLVSNGSLYAPTASTPQPYQRLTTGAGGTYTLSFATPTCPSDRRVGYAFHYASTSTIPNTPAAGSAYTSNLWKGYFDTFRSASYGLSGGSCSYTDVTVSSLHDRLTAKFHYTGEVPANGFNLYSPNFGGGTRPATPTLVIPPTMNSQGWYYKSIAYTGASVSWVLETSYPTSCWTAGSFPPDEEDILNSGGGEDDRPDCGSGLSFSPTCFAGNLFTPSAATKSEFSARATELGNIPPYNWLLASMDTLDEFTARFPIDTDEEGIVNDAIQGPDVLTRSLPIDV